MPEPINDYTNQPMRDGFPCRPIRVRIAILVGAVLLSYLIFGGVDQIAGGRDGETPLSSGALAFAQGEAENPELALTLDWSQVPMFAQGEFPVQAGERWLRLSPENVGDGTLLEINRSDWQEVRLYRVDDGRITLAGQTGVSIEPGKRTVISRRPVFELNPGGEGGFWLLTYRSSEPGFARFTLWSDYRSFAHYQRLHDSLVFGYLGALCLLLVFNLFIYFTTWRSTYGYYAGFLFFHGVSTIGYEGFYAGMGVARWPHCHQILMLSIPLSLYCVLRFSENYLRLNAEFSALSRINRFLWRCCLVLVLQVLVVPFPGIWSGFIVAQSFLVLIGALYLVVLGFIKTREGPEANLVFFVAFVPHGLAVVSFLLRRFEVLYQDPNFYYKLLAASAFEMTLLALGLTLVIRRAREARDAAQRAEIVFLQKSREQEIHFREVLEKEVSQRTAELARSNLDKDRMFSVLAHDLRSPLNSMVRIAESVLPPRRTPPEHELTRILSEIHLTGKSLYRVLENLLEWAKMNWNQVASREEPCDLGAIFAETIPLYQTSIDEKRVGLRTLPDVEEWPLVQFDRDELAIVLRNILSNAVRHTSEKGNIRAEIRVMEDACNLIVENSGEPIASECVEALVEFESPSGDKTSSGIGLVLCRSLLEQHGGGLSIEPVAGVGTRVIAAFVVSD